MMMWQTSSAKRRRPDCCLNSKAHSSSSQCPSQCSQPDESKVPRPLPINCPSKSRLSADLRAWFACLTPHTLTLSQLPHYSLKNDFPWRLSRRHCSSSLTWYLASVGRHPLYQSSCCRRIFGLSPSDCRKCSLFPQTPLHAGQLAAANEYDWRRRRSSASQSCHLSHFDPLRLDCCIICANATVATRTGLVHFPHYVNGTTNWWTFLMSNIFPFAFGWAVFFLSTYSNWLFDANVCWARFCTPWNKFPDLNGRLSWNIKSFMSLFLLMVDY